MGSFATHLVLEERIPDILCHSGHSQNVGLGFLVSLDTDAIVERNAVIPDPPESSEKELAESWVGVIPTTYSNSFADRACSLSSQGASSLSSEHSPSSRLIIESSLFFTNGEFCPTVSRYRGELAVLHYLVKLQEHIERRLDKRDDH